jgi:hypothetical protein
VNEEHGFESGGDEDFDDVERGPRGEAKVRGTDFLRLSSLLAGLSPNEAIGDVYTSPSECASLRAQGCAWRKAPFSSLASSRVCCF